VAASVRCNGFADNAAAGLQAELGGSSSQRHCQHLAKFSFCDVSSAVQT
jgi:hypothetical protein